MVLVECVYVLGYNSGGINFLLIIPFVFVLFVFFFFNDTATTEIYTLSLHDALPIWVPSGVCSERYQTLRVVPNPPGEPFRDVFGKISKFEGRAKPPGELPGGVLGRLSTKRTRHPWEPLRRRDRKSTRLNSSHRCISYAVFCLKKKKKIKKNKTSKWET